MPTRYEVIGRETETKQFDVSKYKQLMLGIAEISEPNVSRMINPSIFPKEILTNNAINAIYINANNNIIRIYKASTTSVTVQIMSGSNGYVLAGTY